MDTKKVPLSLIPPPKLGGGRDGGGMVLLEQKLKFLRERLEVLETQELQKIIEQRERNDMGDDLRENEGAKMTLEDHNLLLQRIYFLKKEIFEIKKKLVKL